MRRLTRYLLILAGVTLFAACGGSGDTPVAGNDTDAAAAGQVVTGKPQGPLTVDYRIIGTPVVGQPVAIELDVHSALGSDPVDVSYRILDTTAMKLADAQPAKVTMMASTDEQAGSQRVTIVPLREGRIYLNVSLEVPTADGSVSTVTAIPVQVGAAPRRPEANGSENTDENGDAIRSLPADESS